MTTLPVGQGHGVAGRYGGLPDEFSSLSKSKVVVIPVGFDQTTSYQQGTDQGPAALIEASRNLELYDIETHSEVYLQGIHTASALQAKSSRDMLDQLYSQTSGYLKQNKFVVALGGEHAISAAPIRAHADHFGKISVLQFDAHADLQDAYEGNPLSHASVMARVKEMPNVTGIVSVGIRSMSSEELKNMDRSKTYFAHEIHGSTDWMDRVVAQLSDPVYITFDLDVFDSAIMPSTGTPEPGGLDWQQVTRLLRRVAASKRVVGLDIVELCPIPGLVAPNFLAAKLLYKFLSYQFHGR
jgi:agmatinase